VVHYKDAYIYAHCKEMVQEERVTDMSNLFILFNGIPNALEPIIREFEGHVRHQGMGVRLGYWVWLIGQCICASRGWGF
jgi:hypothetical protein